MKINVTLPDGRWEITDSKQDGDYRDIELYSEKYEAHIYTLLLTKLVEKDD